MAAPTGEERVLNKVRSEVRKVTEIVDLLHLGEFFGKNLFGLDALTFLKFRVKCGEPGDVGDYKSFPL